jgi:hypothetical protein
MACFSVVVEQAGQGKAKGVEAETPRTCSEEEKTRDVRRGVVRYM